MPAYCLPGEPRLGGAAQLAALINRYRQREETSFLFDSGDMFTGQLSFLTRGEALMDMMISMRYDAMAIGNHEFGVNKKRLVRDYRTESSLGSFVADVMREKAQAEIAIENAGGLRWDIPAGPVNKGHVLDALPFVNYLWTFEMTGAQIREILEQSFSLLHGMAQVSGLRAVYDLRRPLGHRLVGLRIGGEPAD